MSTERVLETETRIFERRKAEFERDHNLEWVVIHGEVIVGFYDDFQKAADTAVRNYGRGPYLIKQIGAPIPPIPASLLYRPINAES